MAKKLTRNDIALKAGVSPSTVSRALAGSPLLPESTIKKINALAREMGYRPNMLAHRLARNKSFQLGFVVPPAAGRKGTFHVSYYSDVLDGVVHQASERGYTVQIIPLLGASPSLLGILKGLAEGRTVDGFVLVGLTNDIPLLRETDEAGFSCVLVGAVSPQGKVPSITYDPSRGIGEMLHALSARGYKRLFYVFGPKRYHDALVQHEALTTAMRRSSLTLAGTIEGNYSIKSGWEAAESILPKACAGDCVFLANDRMAAGFYHFCHERDFKIPDKIAVAGCDDEDIAVILSPELSTIRQPRREMGEAAADALVDLLNGGETQKTRVSIQAAFIQRTSL